MKEQGRVVMQIRYSRSMQGKTWNESGRDRYIYGESAMADTIYHENWDNGSWKPYLSMYANAEESSEIMYVYDRYWTGYEDEGMDGQLILLQLAFRIAPYDRDRRN